MDPYTKQAETFTWWKLSFVLEDKYNPEFQKYLKYNIHPFQLMHTLHKENVYSLLLKLI